ncbi:MAG: thiamine phosphate synthase [Gemmatimonadota bacterium]|nr:thiamine phosphate synthase [Gemmatimonadota bacterium]
MDSLPRFDPAVLRLIAITDSLREGIPGLTDRARRAVAGGATMIQLRLAEEHPRTLIDVARALREAVPNVPLLVNERADVALAAGAQGVHVNVDGITPSALRRLVPSGFIIGTSVGDEAETERVGGADYVGIGPVFGAGVTASAAGAIGLVRFAEIARRCGIPSVAIGGISEQNARAVMSAGASGIAVISALLSAADPMRAARDLRAAQDASGS